MVSPTTPESRPRWRRLARWVGFALVVLVGLAGYVAAGSAWYLAAAASGSPSPAARGTGHDALWLGHAWVDGRRTDSDVEALAQRLRGTGIRDLFVHTGPFADDGSLDEASHPQARWLTGALHAALPGVRVQAWLGAHPTDLPLGDPAVRARVVDSVASVLDEGFDGVHYDFEPVNDGDADLLAMLRETRPLTRAHAAVLSVSASHLEPYPGPGAVLRHLPGDALWTPGYLHEVALTVDQVALMSYDTGLAAQRLYCGYVRKTTERALRAVPGDVGLLVGVPAYPPEGLYHGAAETMTTAIRGVRLAMGERPPVREFGIALYVDFTATDDDWAVYRRDWA
jgi:hypothetical protein